jgi:hypothetical protein
MRTAALALVGLVLPLPAIAGVTPAKAIALCQLQPALRPAAVADGIRMMLENPGGQSEAAAMSPAPNGASIAAGTTGGDMRAWKSGSPISRSSSSAVRNFEISSFIVFSPLLIDFSVKSPQ